MSSDSVTPSDPNGLKVLAQRQTADELHDDVPTASRLARAMDLRDAGMLDAPREVDLAREPRHQLMPLRDMLVQDEHRHVAAAIGTRGAEQCSARTAADGRTAFKALDRRPVVHHARAMHVGLNRVTSSDCKGGITNRHKSRRARTGGGIA